MIDMFQFFIKMAAVIAAAYFAVELPQVGGLSGLVAKLSHEHRTGRTELPQHAAGFRNNWDLAVAVFVMPLAVQWWAVWYPGAEPGGGSYIAQRMLASKSEKDSLGGTLFFNLAHYILRPWPWILVGARLAHRLSRAVRYPDKRFPNVDPSLIGHDMAFPAMLKFLPAGWIGLMVGGLIAANSSTILSSPELGRVLSGSRLLSALSAAGRDRKALRTGGTAGDGFPVRAFVGHSCSYLQTARTTSTSCCRWAREPACSICCAGSGGASRRGARLSR